MNALEYYRIDFMKVYAFLLSFLFFPLIAISQTSSPVFKWKSQEISKDNKLQGMSVHDESTAVIAGLGKTFKISTNSGISWKDVGLINPKYSFNDISIKGNVGYMVGRKAAIIKNVVGGEDDIYVNGVLLKTINGGNDWSVINLSKIGDGTNPSLNPSLTGCYNLNPYTVLTINDSTALVFFQWYEFTSGIKKTHSVVFKTINGGDKWVAITPDFGSAYVNSMKMVGSDIYIGGNKILLKASGLNETVTDFFPAFSAVAGASAYIFEIRSFKENDLNIVTTSGVYNSSDGGKTFLKLNGAPGGNDFFKLDDKTMIVLGTATNSKATTNGGSTWVSCSPGKTCFEIPGIFNDSLYVLSAPNIFKISVNDLKSGNYKWVSKTINEGISNLQKMFFFNESKALLIGDDQIAKKTMDKGISWADAALPDFSSAGEKIDFKSVCASDKAGYVVSRKSLLIDFPSKEDYYLNGPIFKTEDAWKTWKVLNNKNVGKETPTDASKYPLMTGCYGMDNLVVECVDSKTVYLYSMWSDTISIPKTVTKHSRVFKTTDGGDLWTPVTKDFGSSIILSVKFSGETGYLGGNNILMKTTDGGKTFTDLYPIITSGTDNDLIICSISMASSNKVFFQTSNNKGVFYTSNDGATFSKLSDVSGGLDFVVLDNNSFMSVASSTNNKFTNDGGLSWKDCNLGIEIYAAGKVFNDSLYVLGKSNVYKIAVSDLDIKTLVTDLKAANNFKIIYGSSSMQLISAKEDIDRCFIYNISGQLMAIIEPKSTTYSIDNKSFNPGIYLISALIGGERYTQKVIFK